MAPPGVIIMVGVSTGVMRSMIAKLTNLLGDEYNLIKSVKGEIRFLRDELSSMNALLERLADMEEEQIDVQMKEWRNKVRELAYDIEDCIDRFMHRLNHGDAELGALRKTAHKMKMLWESHQIANEIKELKTRVIEESHRRNRYNIDQRIFVPQPAPLDPRAPILYEEAKNLVGVDGPREEIIKWLKGEEKLLKVVSIFGLGGLGKTTLAMEVYHKIGEPFSCWASISVSRAPDLKKLLKDVLFQIDRKAYDYSEKLEEPQLIRTLQECLQDKRYFIIIDDIWSKSAWEHVKSALPENNYRSRIIVTTRIKDVAESCSSSFNDHLYEMRPLNNFDSESLFFRRIFRSNQDCPQELREISDDILKKCGGLPLAIISIASLLASKPATKEMWVKVQNSISSAVEKDCPLDKMKRILFLSYSDLPHHLKTCLLYLSVFPEDYLIDSRRLILRWIAEGFFTAKGRQSMEQLGESYLNELINRSMIHAIDIRYNGTVKFCKVHDMVLDLIIHQSIEENFVTLLTGEKLCEMNKIRRLSLQPNYLEGSEMPKSFKYASHLRSLSVFRSPLFEPVKQVPRFLNFRFLRVLDIEHATYLENCHVEHMGSFFQLKYLRISHTSISKIPEQIGNLQHLEILDLRRSEITKLPSTVVQLQKLVRLFVDSIVVLPDGIENLQALEELSHINLRRGSANFFEGLGKLSKLRSLGIVRDSRDAVSNEDTCKKIFIKSLHKLGTCNLQSLSVLRMNDSDVLDSWMDSCSSPPNLQKIVIAFYEISRIPTWISSLVNLTRLSISYVREVGEEGLRMVGTLPVLLSLTLRLTPGFRERHIIRSEGFQRLVKFNFGSGDGKGLMIEPGAMPKLQKLKLNLRAQYHFKYGGLVFGVQHLLGLRHMSVSMDCWGAMAKEVEALEDNIRKAAEVLPDRPSLEFNRICEFQMVLNDNEGEDHGEMASRNAEDTIEG